MRRSTTYVPPYLQLVMLSLRHITNSGVSSTSNLAITFDGQEYFPTTDVTREDNSNHLRGVCAKSRRELKTCFRAWRNAAVRSERAGDDILPPIPIALPSCDTPKNEERLDCFRAQQRVLRL